MNRKVFFVGLLGAALAVGLVIIGCSNGSGPKYSISGTISLSSGTGDLSKVSVLLSAKPYDISKEKSVYANASGGYTINGVKPGEYQITASLSGYEIATSGTVTVADSDVTGIDIVLKSQTSSPSTPSTPSSPESPSTPSTPKYSVSGTISLSSGTADLSKARVYLWARPSDSSKDKSVYADANGVYTISGVTPGTYYAWASLTGYTPSANIDVAVTGSDVTGIDIALAPKPPKISCTNSGKCKVTFSTSSPPGETCGMSQCNIMVGPNFGPVGTTRYCDCNS